MVRRSRKTEGAGALRPLNPPVPVQVRVDRYHRPLALALNGKVRKKTGILEVWEVDLEWWRSQRIARRYYRVSTEDQRELTIF